MNEKLRSDENLFAGILRDTLRLAETYVGGQYSLPAGMFVADPMVQAFKELA